MNSSQGHQIRAVGSISMIASRESHRTASSGSLRGAMDCHKVPFNFKKKSPSQIFPLLPTMPLSDAFWEDLEREEQALKAVSADWYTDHTLPRLWSTDWCEWERTHFWLDHTRKGVLKIDMLFKHTWKLPGVVRPLAYMRDTSGLYFLFAAGGMYYFYADEELRVREASTEFGSEKEFVDYVVSVDDGSHLPTVVVPQEPGTDFGWW
ncbi:hypothetical protein C8R45DRAFT_116397 [Mycena sanguinolenta]|nr:hypothetical protein C8R45DRAFT_116397 [Mycena sanguinolenta]